jgi:hypothetical protein
MRWYWIGGVLSGFSVSQSSGREEGSGGIGADSEQETTSPTRIRH